MRKFLVLPVLAAALVLPATAGASQLITPDGKLVSLAVDAKGEAMLTYKTSGTLHRVLAWGAENAIPPTKSRKQVAFKLDYSGGWGKYHEKVWIGFKNVCKPYDGPPLAWSVAACTAPDGSFWAVQSWQKMLANYGGTTAPWELHLSHWTGPLPVLSITVDWAYKKFDHLFGTFTYEDKPVYGFSATRGGKPLDTFGRNVYLDTFDSAYGSGWSRENSFLTHTGTGAFCYGFFPHGSHPIGSGTKYRATIIGPGVAPDVMWEGVPAGPFDAAVHLQDADAIRALDDPQCKPV